MTIKRFLVLVAGNIAVLLCILIMIELISYGLYSHPPKGGVWRLAAQEFYRSHEGDIIQYKPDCSQFDSTVSYLLKPGACEFENREFKTQVHINSQGLRDDEESLVAPEIIVLGDSFAMGWGVEQDESFPELLEKKLGKKILNAGISSFGTARESILLNRLDRTNLKLIIIQYNDNDFKENHKFYNYGLEIKTMEEESYIITRHILLDRVKPYRFGKYLTKFIPQLKIQAEHIRDKSPENPKWVEKEDRFDWDQARLAYTVLAGANIDLSTVPILFIEINNHGANNNMFLSHLEQRTIEAREKSDVRNLKIHTLDMSPFLNEEHYFVHDAHMKASGHAVVANLLYDHIAIHDWLN